MHKDRIPEYDDLVSNEEKIQAVRQLYDQATDKDNPNHTMSVCIAISKPRNAFYSDFCQVSKSRNPRDKPRLISL